MLSSIAAAQSEAELKRQRERNKAKERKKRRSNSARPKGNRNNSGASESQGAAAAEDEEFLAFSKFDDAEDTRDEEIEEMKRHQQEIVDADQEEEVEAGIDEAQRIAAEEEEQEAEPVDEEMPDAENDPNDEVALASSDDDEEEEELSVNDDDEVAVDVVGVDSEADPELDQSPQSSPIPSSSSSLASIAQFRTPASGNRGKKRTITQPDFEADANPVILPSTQLSTFSFASSQITYDTTSSSSPFYLLKLRDGDKIAFHGSVEFQVDEGYIEVHGHVFNPRSERLHTPLDSSSPALTSWFTAHSWIWTPHALLTLSAKGSHASAHDEFVASVRIRPSSSRFAPHRLAATLAGQPIPSIHPPTPAKNPYSTLNANDDDEKAKSQPKTPASNKKKGKKRQKVDETSDSSSSAPSETYLRLNIPGFHPVIRSDDEYTKSSLDGADGVPSSKSLYSELDIPEEWQTSLQSMLLPQVPTVAGTTSAPNDEEDEAAPEQLSKAQLAARKQHLKSIRQYVLSAGLRILVFGARNSGKSTLIARMVNLALNRFKKVVYLDLDIGQSTFNTPGLLSLHEITSPILTTSPHTLVGRGVRHGTMIWSCFIGDATQTIDPQRVLHATNEAVRIYEQRYGPQSGATALAPLLVNTQGWLTGLGLDLLQTTVKEIVKPVYLIEVKVEKEEEPEGSPSTSRKKKSLDDDDAEQVLGEVDHPHQLYIFRRTIDSYFTASMTSSASLASAPKLRQLQLLSYFTVGSSAVTTLPFALSSYASIFSTIAPLRVPWSHVALQVLGLDPVCDFHPNSIMSIFNASIVGLCIRPARDTREEVVARHSGVKLLCSGGTTDPFFDSSHSLATVQPSDVCLGLGCIRGIDMTRRCFYVITPITPEQMARVNLFQKGKLELPNIAFGRDAYARASHSSPASSASHVTPLSSAIPYLSTSSLSAGSGLGSREMSSRHNIQRKRLN